MIDWKRTFLIVSLFLHFNQMDVQSLPVQWYVLFILLSAIVQTIVNIFQLKCWIFFPAVFIYLFILLVSGFEMYL